MPHPEEFIFPERLSPHDACRRTTFFGPLTRVRVRPRDSVALEGRSVALFKCRSICQHFSALIACMNVCHNGARVYITVFVHVFFVRMRAEKTGVTADRDKIEFRLFNSSSIFNITLREELFSLPKQNQIMNYFSGFMALVT